MTASASMKLSTFGPLPCAQCSSALQRPEWSERVSECQVRHLWHCRDCGYVFETLVVFSADDGAEIAPPLAA